MAAPLSSFVSRQILRPGLHGQYFLKQLLPGYTVTLVPKAAPARFQHTLNGTLSSILQATKGNGAHGRKPFPWLLKGATVASIGLGLASLRRPVQCDEPGSSPAGTNTNNSSMGTGDLPPPPSSSVSLYELGFGTVAGICAGVFVKKGAKAVAWFLGGIFVLLQYLGSASVVRVDWGRVGKKFENLFFTKDATGATKPPNVMSLWNWTINFLTADFQPRASFIAGFALGLRIG